MRENGTADSATVVNVLLTIPSLARLSSLNLFLHDTNCSGFLGTIEARQLMEKVVVALIGPQSSGVAHVVNELHVPLLLLAADPTLSVLQYPYFLRTTQSNHFQMKGIADMLQYFAWREAVAIFVDDDYGRNGISALGDALAVYQAKIAHKVAFPPGAFRSEISELLVEVNLMKSRVFIVHANPDSGLQVFSATKKLNMVTTGFVWIATDLRPSYLDVNEDIDPDTMDLLQGVIALRHHIPATDMRNNFMVRWKNSEKESKGLNTYSLYAYDSVWLAARALDAYFKEGRNISFSDNPNLKYHQGSSLNVSRLRNFNGESDLLSELLTTNFTGLSGNVNFNADKNLIHPAYDIISMGGTGSRLIGVNKHLLTLIEKMLIQEGPHIHTIQTL